MHKDVQERFQKMQYVLEAHTETINMLIDITAQGGCKSVMFRNLTFCCIQDKDYDKIGRENVLIMQLLENIKKTATFTNRNGLGSLTMCGLGSLVGLVGIGSFGESLGYVTYSLLFGLLLPVLALWFVSCLRRLTFY